MTLPVRRALLRRGFAFLAFTLCGHAPAATEPLITADESAREQRRLDAPVAVARLRAAGAPRIDVVAPDLDAPVAAPVSFRIRFVADSPATIDPASLKVYYGAFRIDITERLLKQAQIVGDTLELADAKIPAGTHRLLVKVKDTLDHVGERLITLTVK